MVEIFDLVEYIVPVRHLRLCFVFFLYGLTNFSSQSQTPKAKAETKVEMAERLRQENKIPAALKLLQDQTDVPSKRLRASLALDSDNLPLALKLYGEVCSKMSDATCTNEYGVALMMVGKYKLAFLMLKKAQKNGITKFTAPSDGRELSLRRGKTVEVQFPALDNEEYNFYQLDKNNHWQEQRRTALPSGKTKKANKAEKKWGSQGQGNQTTIGNQPNQGVNSNQLQEEDAYYVGVRIQAVGSGGVFNFDSPYPYVACVKGDLLDPKKLRGKHTTVMMVGLSFKGFFSRWVEKKDSKFQINVHKKERTKIIVLDEKGNVGVSKVFTAPSKNGFDKKPEGSENYKEDIGNIVMKKLPASAKKSKAALANYLGIYSSNYNINYQDKKK